MITTGYHMMTFPAPACFHLLSLVAAFAHSEMLPKDCIQSMTISCDQRTWASGHKIQLLEQLELWVSSNGPLLRPCISPSLPQALLGPG